MISLQRVDAADKSVLRELLSLYLYELSDLSERDPDAHGRFEYRSLDPYWIDATRHPFFIRRDRILAGFVLVHADGASDAERCIAEFFVLKRHRRAGVGRTAAVATFEHFPGTWEVQAERRNAAGIAFWNRTLASYAPHELVCHDRLGDWNGPVWTFGVGGGPPPRLVEEID